MHPAFRHLPSEEEYVSFGLNDFYHIEDWTTKTHNAAHASDLKWLNSIAETITAREPRRKIIILKHHSPTLDLRSRDPAHTGSKLLSGFALDLSGEECWKSENAKVWAFGHTHWNCDLSMIKGMGRGYSDQRGYYFA
jgi:hypothetical protein